MGEEEYKKDRIRSRVDFTVEKSFRKRLVGGLRRECDVQTGFENSVSHYCPRKGFSKRGSDNRVTLILGRIPTSGTVPRSELSP